jgi:hypothetical protein
MAKKCMQCGGAMRSLTKKAKGGSFPDLTGDGKVTKADILKGRGVIKKGGSTDSAKMKKGGNWIQGAIKRPGAFSAKAKAAGKSTAAYAKSVLKEGSKASTRTKRQAALAQTLGKMRKKK